MKKLLLLLTLTLLCFTSCETDDDVQPVGQLGVVVQGTNGESYKWDNYSSGCGCFWYNTSSNAWSQTNESSCIQNGAGTSPCQ